MILNLLTDALMLVAIVAGWGRPQSRLALVLWYWILVSLIMGHAFGVTIAVAGAVVGIRTSWGVIFNRGREAGLAIAAELLADAAEAVADEPAAVSSDYPVPGGRLL